MDEPKKYQLYDLCDKYGDIGYYDTYQQARKAAKKWISTTGGKCDLLIKKWSEIYQVYTTRGMKEEFLVCK